MSPGRHLAEALLAGLLAASAGPVGAEDQPAETGEGRAFVIDLQGGIGPATRDFLHKSLETAAREQAELLIIRLDTPGGLDASTRDIVMDILASNVPVITYVAPEGARAASAGAYILLASHVAAMSPATNVGAATPVPMGGGTPPGRAPDRPGYPEPEPDEAETGSGADETAAKRESARKGETAGAGEGTGEGETAAAGERAGQGEATSEGESDRPARGEGEPGDDAMTRKVVNDAVAYIRGLAERRGRNADWAESAVRDAASITAEQALELGVIDLIATNLTDLLRQVDGMTVSVADEERKLATTGLVIEQIEPDWRTRLLSAITSPTIAYILLLIGIYGLVLEGYNPGAILPGVVGAIALLLALYALQMLPVNYAGLGLIVLGVVLMIAETLAPSFGVLGFGGIVALVIGSIILIDADVPGFEVSRPLIAAFAVLASAGLMALIWVAVRARRRPVVAGREELIGAIGTAADGFEHEGYVHVHGEEWLARSAVPVRANSAVDVTAIDGLTLVVRPRDH